MREREGEREREKMRKREKIRLSRKRSFAQLGKNDLIKKCEAQRTSFLRYL